MFGVDDVILTMAGSILSVLENTSYKIVDRIKTNKIIKNLELDIDKLIFSIEDSFLRDCANSFILGYVKELISFYPLPHNRELDTIIAGFKEKNKIYISNHDFKIILECLQKINDTLPQLLNDETLLIFRVLEDIKEDTYYTKNLLNKINNDIHQKNDDFIGRMDENNKQLEVVIERYFIKIIALLSSSKKKSEYDIPRQLPFNNLPFIKNERFTGRDTILNEILVGFIKENAISLTQNISGLGGVGKTQTALEYAYRYANIYDVIWWLNAETDQTIKEGFLKFAQRNNIMQVEKFDEEIIIDTVLEWMDNNRNWLFIYDNVDDYVKIKQYMPRYNRGNILMTTRYAYPSVGDKIEVNVFNIEESVNFLIKRTQIEDEMGAKKLSEKLGYLPLALEQAGAYIWENKNCTYQGYLRLMKKYGIDIFEQNEYITDYSLPITITWNISLNKIVLESAKQLLYLCSYFAPDDIELKIFIENSSILPELLKRDIENELKFHNVIRELTKYSMVTFKNNTLSIHRLTQEVIRRNIKDYSWIIIGLHICEKVFFNDYFSLESLEFFRKNAVHGITLADRANELPLNEDNKDRLAKLYLSIGHGYLKNGNYYDSKTYFEKAVDVRKRMRERETHGLVNVYRNLALAYKALGDYDEAIAINKKALRISKKISGIEHTETAKILVNIAVIYKSKREYENSLIFYQEALNIMEKNFGLDHINSAIIYCNIGAVHQEQEKYEEAMIFYHKALLIRERDLGTQHPETAIIYHNMGGIYKDTHEYQKAEEFILRALTIKEKVFGKRNPKTANSYHDMAELYELQGDYEGALRLYKKALYIYEIELGERHENTILTYNNLSNVFKRLGNDKKSQEFANKAQTEISETCTTENSCQKLCQVNGIYTK